jgi:hypothetical protein
METHYYGGFPLLAAFPELDASILRQFAAAQAPDGRIPGELGLAGAPVASQPSTRIAQTAAASQPQPSQHQYDGYAVSVPLEFCLAVSRHYQWTGDRAFLQQMWPNVKRAIDWVRARDEDNDGLPETHAHCDGTLIAEKRVEDANLWAATLVSAMRLAADLGEAEYGAQLRLIHARALAALQRFFWMANAGYYRAALWGSAIDACTLRQMPGTWHARVLGFQDGVPPDRIRSALRAMMDSNGQDVPFGLIDNRWAPLRGQTSQRVDLALNYAYASACQYEGLDEPALRVCDAIWGEYTVEKCRQPWTAPEVIPDGRHPVCIDREMPSPRNGAALVMSYAAGGLQLDVPAGSARVRPADWVWKNDRFTLPVVFPRWVGQVKYARAGDTETYELTNLAAPLELKNLYLRTGARGLAQVVAGDASGQGRVSPDGVVSAGSVTLAGDPLIVRIKK